MQLRADTDHFFLAGSKSQSTEGAQPSQHGNPMSEWARKELKTLITAIEDQFGNRFAQDSLQGRYESNLAEAKRLLQSANATNEEVAEADEALRNLQQDLIFEALRQLELRSDSHGI